MAKLLEIRGLTRAFGGLVAVNAVDLDVGEGELVSVIGPNGAGKTTLFNIVTGLETPDAGTVHLAGRDITAVPAEQLAPLGMARTFQHGRVFGNLSVMDNVLVGAHSRLAAVRPSLPLVGALTELALALVRPARVRQEEQQLRDEVREILTLFGERLTPRVDHPAFSLSYANRRRVEIARALAAKPRLLMMDEPTAGMNPTETLEMLEIIRGLKARGMTILLIEHKLELVMQLSDRVIVMDGGMKIAEGEPVAVASDPRVIEAYLGHGSIGGKSASAEAAPLTRPLPPSAAPVLELDRVDTFYGPTQVHFELSLQVGKGQIVSLLGGNASGKSTTMKVVLGLVTPRSGAIKLEGTDITGWPTPRVIRQGIGSVPEARRLFGGMSVRENVLMGAYTRSDAAEVAQDYERMLTLFPRLAERRDQLAGTLSGGEQQMVAMARALMGRPRVLCMDEPTMGLSPLFVDRVLEQIRAVNKQGVTVFMIEQNAHLALQIADFGYVLQSGRIALSGTAKELLGDPRIRDAYLGGGTDVVSGGRR